MRPEVAGAAHLQAPFRQQVTFATTGRFEQEGGAAAGLFRQRGDWRRYSTGTPQQKVTPGHRGASRFGQQGKHCATVHHRQWITAVRKLDQAANRDHCDALTGFSAVQVFQQTNYSN